MFEDDGARPPPGASTGLPNGHRGLTGHLRPVFADRPVTVSDNRMPRGWRVGTVLVFLLAGALLGTARSYSHGQDIRNRSVDLSVLIKSAAQRVAAGESEAATVQTGIDKLAGSDLSPQVAGARQSAAGLRAAAGLTAVRGPALLVSMSDAPRNADGKYADGVDPDDLVVHQQDVQSVVNALWAGGAEAMMIMDQRVIATSAVRCIGNTLLLHGRTYSPPFLLVAVGDAARMGKAMGVEPGVALFQTYVQKFKLGFEVKPVNDVTLPAYADVIRMTAAHRERR